MKIENVKIYRITHIENIPYILENGITNSNSNLSNPNFKNIGDTSLILRRKNYKVIVDNGENEINESIVLGDYIPFYFGVKMPMLYVIQNGGNFVPTATLAENIVYLVCSLNKIVASKKTFYFTDGHATDSFTTFYNLQKLKTCPLL